MTVLLFNNKIPKYSDINLYYHDLRWLISTFIFYKVNTYILKKILTIEQGISLMTAIKRELEESRDMSENSQYLCPNQHICEPPTLTLFVNIEFESWKRGRYYRCEECERSYHVSEWMRIS